MRVTERKILMLDLMLKQMQDKHVMSKDVIKRVNEELVNLSSSELDSVQAYLTKRNGKKMKGTEHIWKYALNKGDRILYSRSCYFPYLNKYPGNLIVLLGYAKHDDQGFFAREHDFTKEKKFIEIKEYVEQLRQLSDTDDINEISAEDLYTIAEINEPKYLSPEHAAYEVDPEKLASMSAYELDENPVLSPDQAEKVETFINDPSPTLILGGAGTGKTLVELHILNDYMAGSNNNSSAAYFTQSEELLGNAKKRFTSISDEEDIPEMFYEINDYCLDRIRDQEGYQAGKSNLVTQSVFEKDFFSKLDAKLKHKCDKNKIDAVSAWTEIRGIIKGQLDPNWCRTVPQRYENVNIKELVEEGWFERDIVNPAEVILSEDPDKTLARLKKDNSLTPAEKECVKTACKYFSSVDPAEPDMGKENYISLSSENTTLMPEQREVLWQVYEEYINYLNKNKKYDDNDIIRKSLELLPTEPDRFERFDFIAVDEIQDYTELQIYFLHELSKDRKHIVYCGDANQNVNPTLFREEKLQRLYRNQKDKTLKSERLTGNYRCPEETVKLTNELSKLRKEKIGSGKLESEIEETSGRTGTEPFILKYSEKNIADMLDKMKDYSSTAFLVPDEQSKQQAISVLGEDVYKDNKNPFIHTVAEIKGMEYAYVVCFDLFGRHRDVWNNIFSPEHKKKKTGERYYFNLPYVAMTRTQQHLCIIDSDLHPELKKRFDLKEKNIFDAESMYFSTLRSDSSAWLAAARENEKNMHYKDAVIFYEKAGAPFKDIRRCKARISADEGNYHEAALNAFIARDKEAVFRYKEKLHDEDELGIMLRMLLDLNESDESGRSVCELVDSVFGNYDCTYEELTEVRLFCIELLDDLLNRYMDQTEDWVNDISD